MLNILAMVKSVAMKIGVHVSFGIKVFSRNMPTSEVLGHMVILFFFSFKITKTVVHHSGSTSLHADWQCKKVTFSAHTLQKLLFVDFWMMTLLTDVK